MMLHSLHRPAHGALGSSEKVAVRSPSNQSQQRLRAVHPCIHDASGNPRKCFKVDIKEMAGLDFVPSHYHTLWWLVCSTLEYTFTTLVLSPGEI